MSKTHDISREAIMNSYRDGSMNELLTDDDCREIFIGILKGGSDITKGLLYELLREYDSSPDLVIIDAPFEHPVEIAHAVIARLINPLQFDSNHKKTIKVGGVNEVLSLDYNSGLNWISIYRKDDVAPIAYVAITHQTHKDPIETQNLIDSYYSSLLSQLHSFQLQNT